MRWIMIAILLAVVSAGISNSAYTQRRSFKRTVRNESAEKNFAKAAMAFRNNKTEAAVTILKENVAQFPDHWPSFLLLAKIHYLQNDFKSAVQYIKHAIRINPNNKSANMLAAALFLKEGKTLKAANLMRRAQSGEDIEDDDTRLDNNEMTAIQSQVLNAHKTKAISLAYEKSVSESVSITDKTLPTVDESKQLKVAVFTFDVSDSNNQQFGISLSEMMTTAMVQTRCFQIVERQQLNKLFQEQDLEMTDAIDQETAVEIGKFIGVDAVFVGHCWATNADVELDGRLVDIQSGKIITAANTQYKPNQAPRSAVNELAVVLAKTAYK